MKLVYDFFEDGQHGWLKVSIDELEELGIENKIDSSFMRKDQAYLEEDCDCEIFLRAKKEKIKTKTGKEVEIKIKNHYSNPSKIRNYESYDYIEYVKRIEWNKIKDEIVNAKSNEIAKQIINDYQNKIEQIEKKYEVLA